MIMMIIMVIMIMMIVMIMMVIVLIKIVSCPTNLVVPPHVYNIYWATAAICWLQTCLARARANLPHTHRHNHTSICVKTYSQSTHERS